MASYRIKTEYYPGDGTVEEHEHLVVGLEKAVDWAMEDLRWHWPQASVTIAEDRHGLVKK